jgi:hypothetical protein
MDAAYRLGNDASAGVGALMTVTLPQLGRSHPAAITVDIAASLASPLSLVEVADVWRDALLAAAVQIPDALAELLPVEATVARVELHLVADNTDAKNFNRPNDLERRVDWQPLGTRTRDFGRSLGAAATVSGPLSEHDIAELVAGAFDHMLSDGGVLDPREAIEQMRRHLLPAG